MNIDVDQLSRAISDDLPSGEDLSYDPAYIELETLAKGTEETQFSEGAEPDWKAIHRQCIDLLGRTKDLRVGVHLALTGLQTDGFPGFRDALAVMRNTIENFWDSFHPQLDPDDHNDPLERMNILVSLAPPAGTYEDPMQFKDRVLDAPLASSVQLGRFCLRDLLIRDGDLKGEGQEAGLINAGFMDCDLDELQATAAAIREGSEHVRAIDEFITGAVGAGVAVDLSGLVKVLEQASHYTAEYLLARGVGVEEETLVVEGGEAGGGGGSAGRQQLSGDISSIQDVLHAMDKIDKFYRQYEPSSPVPLIMTRAKKLVGRNFIEILQDLSPDAIQRVEVISGKSASEMGSSYGDEGPSADDSWGSSSSNNDSEESVEATSEESSSDNTW